MKFNQKKILITALLFSYAANGYGVVWVGGSNGDKETGVNSTPESILIQSNSDRVAISANGTFTIGATGKVEVAENSTSTVGGIEIQNTGGTLINNGTIVGNSKTAVQIKGDGAGKSSGINNATINIQNPGTVGVQVLGANGSFENSSTGIISADKGSIGILAQSGSQILNNGEIIASGTGSKGIDISGETSLVNNSGTVHALDKATGITVNGGTFKNSGKVEVNTGATGVVIGTHGKFSNEGDIVVNGDGSTGIRVSSFVSGNIINSETGNITVQGVRAQGIDITTASKGDILNQGTINVLGNDKLTAGTGEATGVKVNGKDVNFINEGTINSVGAGNVESGYNTKGINIESGSAVNKGVITASNGGNAVHVKTNFTNDNIIDVSGKSVGISVDNAATALDPNSSKGVINSTTGVITVRADSNGNGGKGVKVSGNGSFLNEGTIVVSAGTGISAETLTAAGKGTIENSGNIYVEGANSTGIQANAFNSVTNSGTINVNAGQFTSGMKANGNSSKVVNSEKGTINHLGSGATSNAMIAQNGGTAINKGSINVSGKNSSAIASSGAEVNFTDPTAFSTAINEGNINVYDGAYGIKLEGKKSKTGEFNYARGSNTGTITSVGGAAAVYLNGGIFTNEGGEILAGPDGKAIISYNNAANPSNNIIKLSKGSGENGKQTKIEGAVIGGNGLDVLVLDGKNGENIIEGLDISKYEAIVLTGNQNSTLENSRISLEYNSGIRDYLEKEKENIHSEVNKSDNSSLTLKNSALSIDFKDSLVNPNIESPIIDANEIKFVGDTYLSFNSSDGRQEFNLNEALGGDIDINHQDANFVKTIIWSYDLSDGNLIAKKERYYDVLSHNKLDNFAKLLEDKRVDFGTGAFNDALIKAEQFATSSEFTDALSQISGGQYGYLSDIALNNLNSVKREINYRMSNSLDNMDSAPNTYTTNAFYLNFENSLGGLMSVKEKQNSAIGTFEKQISEKQRMGLFFGGGHGSLEFNGGKIGSANLDILYAGAFLNNRFSPYLSLSSQFGFEHQFASVKRIIDYTDTKHNFSATTPTMVFGLSSQLDLNVPINRNWDFSLYTGLAWSKIVQGNILEKDDNNSGNNSNELMVRNNTGTLYYDSVKPSMGLNIQNSNFILGKRYTLLLNANYEAELGNIKDSKKVLIKKLGEHHTLETTDNIGLFSVGALATLNLNEKLSINAGYTNLSSSEYNSDRISGGFKYNFDDLSNTFTAPFISAFDGTPVDSRSRFRASLTLSLDGENLDDRENSGSYQTTTILTPKLKLGINDTQSNLSYYFEAYKKNNTWFDTLKEDSYNPEGKATFSRFQGEVRYTQPKYWGNYGLSLGYRIESGAKQRLIGPSGSANNKNPYYITDKSEVQEIRITPSFRYRITDKLTFGGSTIFVNAFTTIGERKDCYDLRFENQYGVTYALNNKWRFSINYFREDRFLDLDYITFDTLEGYNKIKSEGYLLEQLRPSLLYTLDNGSSVELNFRIPLNQGLNYIAEGGNSDSNIYESRYGIKYNHRVSPTLSTYAGINMVTTKYTKKSDGSSTRTSDLKTEVGFTYNFGF